MNSPFEFKTEQFKKPVAIKCVRMAGNNPNKPLEERHYGIVGARGENGQTPCATYPDIIEHLAKQVDVPYLMLADIDGAYIVSVKDGSITDYRDFIYSN